MSEFMDPDVTTAHRRLLDALCSWERATGREITVLVLPHDGDEPIAVSYSGKPGLADGLDQVLQAVGAALEARRTPREAGR